MRNEKINAQCIFILYPQQIISGKFDSHGSIDFLTNKIVNELEQIKEMQKYKTILYLFLEEGKELKFIIKLKQVIWFLEKLLDQLEYLSYTKGFRLIFDNHQMKTFCFTQFLNENFTFSIPLRQLSEFQNKFQLREKEQIEKANGNQQKGLKILSQC